MQHNPDREVVCYKQFFLTSELGNEYLAIIFYYLYLEMFEQFAF